jgi:dihydrofolate reductase
VARTVLCMSMSLDGFITGPDDDATQGLGRGGERLHDWVMSEGPDGPRIEPEEGPSRVVFDELMQTGAVLAGRRTAEFASYWGGDHHDGVPIFVPTSQQQDVQYERVTFVTDGIASCVAQAKDAAGERDILVHGAVTAQECLRAGLLDVLEIQLVPVLLGQGRLLFDGLEPGQTELDLVRTIEAPRALHLRYEVRRS